jgi:hypothetical protein
MVKARPVKGGALVYRVVSAQCEGGNIGIVIYLLIAIFPFYVIIEGYYTLSVVPLITSGTAILALTIGAYVLRNQKLVDRLTLLSVLACLILTTKYIDWNSRKPLVRDMYKIAIGMSFDEVDAIMRHHIGHDGEPNSVEANDTQLSYVTQQGADMVSIHLSDGKVTSIIFKGE